AEAVGDAAHHQQGDQHRDGPLEDAPPAGLALQLRDALRSLFRGPGACHRGSARPRLAWVKGFSAPQNGGGSAAARRLAGGLLRALLGRLLALLRGRLLRGLAARRGLPGLLDERHHVAVGVVEPQHAAVAAVLGAVLDGGAHGLRLGGDLVHVAHVEVEHDARAQGRADPRAVLGVAVAADPAQLDLRAVVVEPRVGVDARAVLGDVGGREAEGLVEGEALLEVGDVEEGAQRGHAEAQTPRRASAFAYFRVTRWKYETMASRVSGSARRAAHASGPSLAKRSKEASTPARRCALPERYAEGLKPAISSARRTASSTTRGESTISCAQPRAWSAAPSRTTPWRMAGPCSCGGSISLARSMTGAGNGMPTGISVRPRRAR